MAVERDKNVKQKNKFITFAIFLKKKLAVTGSARGMLALPVPSTTLGNDGQHSARQGRARDARPD